MKSFTTLKVLYHKNKKLKCDDLKNTNGTEIVFRGEKIRETSLLS